MAPFFSYALENLFSYTMISIKASTGFLEIRQAYSKIYMEINEKAKIAKHF